MSVQNGERLATKQDLADMYQGILPYLGGMPEMLANKFSKGDLYSTDEKIIGQWIDSKPLYQKVINFGNLPNTTTKSVAHNISNVETIFIKDGFAKTATDDFNTLPYLRIDNSNYGIEVSVNPTNVTIKTYADRSAWIGYVILQYTKITDSAISIGSDTDYSTEEKIVGTWIDGKPLYQRSFYVPSISLTKGQFYTIPNSTINNIDLLISMQGTAVDTYSNRITLPMINTADVTQGLTFEYLSGGFSFRTHNDGYSNFTKICITAQYTKTTD